MSELEKPTITPDRIIAFAAILARDRAHFSDIMYGPWPVPEAIARDADELAQLRWLNTCSAAQRRRLAMKAHDVNDTLRRTA